MRAAEIKSAALIHFLWTETKSNSEYDQRQVQPRKSTARKKGHIIVTSSVAGTRSVPGNAVYAGTKHFVRAMLDSFRAESVMEGTHIRTTLIYPCLVYNKNTQNCRGDSPKLQREIPQ